MLNIFKDQDILDALSNNGIGCQNGKLIKLSNYKGKDPYINDRLDFYNQINESHQVQCNAQLKLQWINKFLETTNSLISKQYNWTVISAFWVHLHGIVQEFIDNNKKELSQLRKILPSSALWKAAYNKAELNEQSPLPMFINLINISTKIKDLFDTDDLIYIDNRRQTECHITQSNYEIRWDDKNNKIKKSTIRVINKTIPVKDAHTSIKKTLSKYSTYPPYPDETAIAIKFAQRIKKSSLDTQLLDISKLYYGAEF
jgi:hypothetical protein